MELSVVVPSWNARALLRECLASLAEAARDPRLAGGLEAIVVDDASTDGSADLVAREFPDVRLLRLPRNRGFSFATNEGCAAARGELVLLLNADARIGADDLVRLRDFLRAHPGHAAAAPRLVGPDGRTQRACMAYPRLVTALYVGTPLERWWPGAPELRRYYLRAFDHERDADVEQPPGACLLLRRAALAELPGGAARPLDERMELFYSDVDLCRRLTRAGWRLRYLAGCGVRHVGGASTRQRADFVPRWQADRLAYYRAHFGRRALPWLKLCVAFGFADWALRTAGARLLRRPAEPLLPTTRAFGAFLRSR